MDYNIDIKKDLTERKRKNDSKRKKSCKIRRKLFGGRRTFPDGTGHYYRWVLPPLRCSLCARQAPWTHWPGSASSRLPWRPGRRYPDTWASCSRSCCFTFFLYCVYIITYNFRLVNTFLKIFLFFCKNVCNTNFIML